MVKTIKRLFRLFFPSKWQVDHKLLQEGINEIMMAKPIKMSVYDFEGEKTIAEWESDIEEIAIQMVCATDKQGLAIMVDPKPMIDGFMMAVSTIRGSMNNAKGSGGMLVPYPSEHTKETFGCATTYDKKGNSNG